MAYPLKYWDGSSWNTVAQAAVDYSFVPQPNLLDNGAFDVWQRGTGSFNPGSGEGYTADRWLVTGAGVVNRQRHPVGTAFRGTVPKYYLHMERGAAGNHPSLTQRVEDACTAAGQTVTMSFWVRAPQAWNAGSWQVGWVQYFGTGGSSYVADFGVHTFVPTADWQLVQATFTLPSVTGKSVNDSDSYLALMLRNNSNAATTGQLDVWGVKLEIGSTATAFQHKSFAEELRECQRYFEAGNADPLHLKVIDGTWVPWVEREITYVRKRATPSSIVVTATSTDNASPGNGTVLYSNQDSMIHKHTVNNSSFPYCAYSLSYTVSADL